ncbi:hypothetical protein KX729_28675 [Rhizobium sp. XQZ8]|uniref:hypothetical protein n=1 Tax=Rhizobium populisoli TaxID=2859785 RepID=UPI001CA483AA|nr:hypothetical protein [Rhizobium populisoli]MBW6425406.1 hypothetical protein [Rhizobium populisoli]
MKHHFLLLRLLPKQTAGNLDYSWRPEDYFPPGNIRRTERHDGTPSAGLGSEGPATEVIMADPKSKQPAEGSCRVIDKELRRQDGESRLKAEQSATPKDPAPRSKLASRKERR